MRSVNMLWVTHSDFNLSVDVEVLALSFAEPSQRATVPHFDMATAQSA